MAIWHPPIPVGKLYSEDALRLGPGIALLAWCYDNVQRGGIVEIDLQRIARDIGKPYGTIRDWWRLLRDGPFFAEQTDKGKRGWVVRLADDWLDWRIMKHNYPDAVKAEMSALNERRDVNVEAGQSSVNAPSKLNERRDVSVKQSAYKVDHTDHETGRETHAKTRAPPTDDIAYSHLAVITYQNYFKRWPDLPDAKKIAAVAVDFELWSSICDLWKQNRWDFLKVDNLINRYQNRNANGTHQPIRHANSRSRTVAKRLDNRDD